MSSERDQEVDGKVVYCESELGFAVRQATSVAMAKTMKRNPPPRRNRFESIQSRIPDSLPEATEPVVVFVACCVDVGSEPTPVVVVASGGVVVVVCVAVAVGVGVGVDVAVGLGVGVAIGVCVREGVTVGLGVDVDVGVAPAVGVAPDTR